MMPLSADNVNFADQPIATQDQSESPDKGSDSMQEYYQLRQNLYLVTLSIAVIVFVVVWITYNLNIALNYLLGACVGLVYLRMLSKEVERLGSQTVRIANNRLALVIGLVIVGTQLQQLHIVPIVLGFLSYKAAMIIYVLQINLFPAKK